MSDRGDEQAVFGIARKERGTGMAPLEEAVPKIEAESAPLFGFSMTFVTFGGERGPDSFFEEFEIIRPGIRQSPWAHQGEDRTAGHKEAPEDMERMESHGDELMNADLGEVVKEPGWRQVGGVIPFCGAGLSPKHQPQRVNMGNERSYADVLR
jgi:hypothetical protein